MKLREVLLVMLVAMGVSSQAVAAATKYDVLELPAVQSEMAAKSLIYSITKVGDRHYATGHFGHILYSDDGGDSWTQAEVPVRSSILDIAFPTPEKGWAVGHEGVILHSEDGGKSWVKQFDGLRYGEEGLTYYKDLQETDPDNEFYQFLVEEMDFAISQGADKPLFKVHFHNESFGHAGGAYGMLLRTDNGGKSWQPVLHNVENDSFYHLFDAAPLPGKGRFFLTGEAGLFLIGDVTEETARKVHSVPWEGSFFTSVTTTEGNIVMGGLRGRMFRTEDEGQSWLVVKKPPSAAVVDSTRLEDGRLIVVTIDGQVMVSVDDGLTFARLPISNGGRIYAVAEGSPGTLLLGGPAGVQKFKLPQ